MSNAAINSAEKFSNAQKGAYAIVKKEIDERKPFESNLLLSILFKVFDLVDPRIARCFSVLNALLSKL